ncbi:hypothetical protein [Desulfovibrio oxyclinae]|uniref:hypothetical protein n=1 Tax=Desulfovibrio oxyclinae TaxID=63560 RepID=UPI00037DE4A3|nr:hypothetical protein [Desulfovibrio oxyclinae]
MNIPFIGPLIDLIASPVKGWVERKKVREETRLEIEKLNAQAAIKRAEMSKNAEIDWDAEAMRQRKFTLVDEAWTLATLAMLVGCFVPDLQPYMRQGFEVLKDSPWWLELAVVGQIVAAFGLRWLFKDFITRFKIKR